MKILKVFSMKSMCSKIWLESDEIISHEQNPGHDLLEGNVYAPPCFRYHRLDGPALVRYINTRVEISIENYWYVHGNKI